MGRNGIGLLKSLVLLIVLVTIPAAIVYKLSGQFQQISVWKQEVEVFRASQDASRLLDALYKESVVRFDHIVPEFSQDPCEALRDDAVAHQAKLENVEVSSLLDELCNSTIGKVLRNEMQVWNGSFQLLAVRDNGERGDKCSDDNRAIGPVVTLGCRPAQWVVSRLDPGGKETAVQVERRFPPQRAFAHIAKRGGAAFADWLMVSSSEVGDPAGAKPVFVLRRTLTGTGDVILLDLIGTPSIVTVGGQDVAIDAGFATGAARSFSAGGIKGIAILLCSQSGASGNEPDCAASPGAGEAHSWRIALNGIPKNRDIEIAIRAEFSQNLPDDLLAYNKTVAAKGKETSVSLKRSDHLEVQCEFKRQSDCKPVWSVNERRERLERKRYRLLLKDGRELVDADGQTTNLTFELGLTALVGFSPRDNGSLSAGLAALPLEEDKDFTLTIDPGLQAQAMREIQDEVKAKATTEFRQANARGAVVMLDAGDDPATRGDILAVASVPAFVPGLNEWDLLALAEAGGALNPLAGHAWRQSDVHASPGSSFKTISGYAAIEAALSTPELQDLILGKIPPAQAAARLGSENDHVIVRDPGRREFPISGGFSKAVKPANQSRCPPGNAQSQMGLCEALIVSSNPWFAGVNLLVDGAVAGVKDAGANSNLATSVGKLFPLLTPADKEKGGCAKCIDLTWGAVPQARRARLEAIDVPMISRPLATNLDVALNSFGQGVRAAPMAMTALYASLASGRVTIPRIIAEGKERPFANIDTSILSGSSPFEAEAMASLVAGLKGVVDSPFGTARGDKKFGVHKGRVFGKTGTADTGDSVALANGLPNSVSFTGWVEPGENLERKIAFTCWMTHLPAGNFGGGVCAPLIGRILNNVTRVSAK